MNLHLQTDIDVARLNVAMQLGAAHMTHHCSIKSTENPEQLASEILSTLGSDVSPDCSIECSGADSSLRVGIHVRLFFRISVQYYRLLAK